MSSLGFVQAMYEAAARDFLSSRFSDGEIIKLRLLQSDEFRESLETYGAALNVSAARNAVLWRCTAHKRGHFAMPPGGVQPAGAGLLLCRCTRACIGVVMQSDF